MDLVQAQHPTEFADYATRDAIVTAEWLSSIGAFADNWNATRGPRTLSSLSVNVFMATTSDLHEFLGREIDKKGRLGGPLPEQAAIQTLVADGFHGGRNEAFVTGVFTARPGRVFTDYDLKGAYTSALGYMRVIDWSDVEHTRDIERLAQLDEPSVATVDFEFPAGTRFPSLPVADGDNGLVYTRKGVTTAIGPELALARQMGATLKVRAGIRLHWDDADGERPFVAYAQKVNQTRALYKDAKPAFEKAAKECGNALYGKTAQGVGGMKSNPVIRNVFDTRQGRRRALPPSDITTPIIAAYASGIPRAAVSEILSRLPEDVIVTSVTTDGFTSGASSAEIAHATVGPVCKLFSDLRVLVDPKCDPGVVEIKHKARSVFTGRTRLNFTVEKASEADEPDPKIRNEIILARGGQRLETRYDNGQEEAEAGEWLALAKRRTLSTTLLRRSFAPPVPQWVAAADLTMDERPVVVSMDYDFKREIVLSSVSDTQGMISFQTTPWEDIHAFNDARRAFVRWKAKTKSILKTSADLARLNKWRTGHRTRSGAIRTDAMQSIMVAMAKGLYGFPRHRGRGIAPVGSYSNAAIAKLLTDAGVQGVKERIVEHAARREPDPAQIPYDELYPGDLDVIEALGAALPRAMIDGLFPDFQNDVVREEPIASENCDKRYIDQLVNAPKPISENSVCENHEKISGSPMNEIIGHLMPPNWGGGDIQFGGISSASPIASTAYAHPAITAELQKSPPSSPKTVSPPGDEPPCSPDQLAKPSAVSLSDWRDFRRIKAALATRYRLGPVGTLMGQKAAAKRPGLDERHRMIVGLAIALAAKIDVPEPTAFDLIAAIAAETETEANAPVNAQANLA
jgi:hypothetical protein